MRLPHALLALLLLSPALAAAQLETESHRDHVFARLSYSESGVFRSQRQSPADKSPQDFSIQTDAVRLCISVAQNRTYRVVMTLNGKLQHLQGKMPDEQFQRLRNLLSATDFRSLSGSHGGMLLQRAETFGAEVAQSYAAGTGSQRLQWLNPDGANPFPQPVSRVVAWLKSFKPAGATSFVESEISNVCPTFGVRLLEPAVAANQAR